MSVDFMTKFPGQPRKPSELSERPVNVRSITRSHRSGRCRPGQQTNGVPSKIARESLRAMGITTPSYVYDVGRVPL